jgi:hypothetical protein
VSRAKPPVREPNDGRDADAGQRRQTQPVDGADRLRRPMPPE